MSKKPQEKNKSYILEVVVKDKYLVEVVASSVEEARKIAMNIPQDELQGQDESSERTIGRIWYGNHSC